MKPDLNAYRTKLEALRDRVKRQMQGLTEEALPESRGEGNWTTPIDDFADVSARKAEEALTLGIVANDEQWIAAIDAALNRLEKGTFGKCETCGKAIAQERLHAAPYASECIHCARQRQAV